MSSFICAQVLIIVPSRDKSKIIPRVGDQPYLLDGSASTIIPKQPSLSIKQGEGLVHCRMIPIVDTETWTHDWIHRTAAPVMQAVGRMSDADLCVLYITEPYIKHDYPAPLVRHNLARRHLAPFPGEVMIGGKNGVLVLFLPSDAVTTDSIADRVGFGLLPSRVPHFELLFRWTV